MKLSLRQLGLLSACLLLCVFTALATSVVIPSDDELIVGARAIVRGTVTSVNSRFDDPRQAIFTYITLDVREVLKGDLPSRGEITIKEPGGIVGDRGSRIFGTPQFTPGEEVLLFLDTWSDGSLRVYHWFLGKYVISTSRMNNRPVATRQTPEENVRITGRAPGLITDRMDLDSYLQMIRARVAATAEQTGRHKSRYFARTPLLVTPPEMANPYLANPVQNFTFINPNAPPRWFEPDSGAPVVFRINTAGAPGGTALADVTAALAAWSNLPGSALRLASGGATNGCGLLVADGENTVSFNNCDNYSPFSPPAGQTCSGILAAAGIIRFSTAQTKVIGGITFYRAVEGNLSFNPFASCYFSNSCNVREVATHELGHALGLGHSLDAGATMYAYAHFDGRCAGLRNDDIAAIQFIYPGSGGTPPPPAPTPTPVATPTPTPPPASPIAITTTSLPAGTVGVTYSAQLVATGGTSPYTWNAVSGVMPPGVFLNFEGGITGRPSAPGSFAATYRVNDSAGRSTFRTLTIAVAGGTPVPTPTPIPTPTPAPTPTPGPIPPPNSTVAIATTALPGGQVGLSYAATLTATGGTGSYTWNAISGSMAPGVFLFLDGRLSGRPTAAGSFTVLFRVNDSLGNSAQRSLTINVGGTVPPPGPTPTPAPGPTPIPTPTPTPPPPPTPPPGSAVTIATAFLPKAQKNISYSASLIAAGGTEPYSWNLVAGSLPSGLQLKFSGIIMGRPLLTGIYAFTVRATDSKGASAQKSFTLTVSSSTSLFGASLLTTESDESIAVPGDYDGDGAPDRATWQPADGQWRIAFSSGQQRREFNLGVRGDTPAPADYDGDGRTDAALWRASTGFWYIQQSSTGAIQSLQWGMEKGDTPAPADYDGDGKADVAVWRSATGQFLILYSSDAQPRTIRWGETGDLPVPADYDGDGRTDLAVWRPATGVWSIRQSADGVLRTLQWGAAGDLPAAADADGDGRADPAIRRPGEAELRFASDSARPERRGRPIGRGVMPRADR